MPERLPEARFGGVGLKYDRFDQNGIGSPKFGEQEKTRDHHRGETFGYKA